MLCSHAVCKTAQHETPTRARCSCLLFQIGLSKKAAVCGPFVPCRSAVTLISDEPSFTIFSGPEVCGGGIFVGLKRSWSHVVC